MGDPVAIPAVASGNEIVEHRRRLLRAGFASGPVLMTVFSRPVFANRDCASMQVMISATTGTSLQCTNSSSGMLPGSWVTHTASWPPPYSAG